MRPYRFVVRPNGINTTPRLLAEAINARACVNGAGTNPHQSRRLFSIERDFFTYYPRPDRIIQQPIHRSGIEAYKQCFEFHGASKLGQRRTLVASGIPCPASFGTRDDALRELGSSLSRADYIVRPLRHSQGRGYRRTSDPTDFIEGQEYIQRVYEKDFEYRIVFVEGTPLFTLIKKVPEGTRADQPWNHATGSTFVTVRDERNNRLRDTNVYVQLANTPVVKHASIVGADIMVRRIISPGGVKTWDWVVCELNYCPSVTLPENLERIRQHVEDTRNLRLVRAA